jgi:hypothetical protein
MMKVTRPAYLTAFGGEWVQLFPKDSWENTTNEYEPFTFNMYGAKIPLPGFRSTPTGIDPDHPDAPADTGFEAIDGTGLSLQSADGTVTEVAGTVGPSAAAATTDYVNVFMEVSDDGDYEVMYGNPNLRLADGKWVAVQFRSTLLRVGTPWADCTNNEQDAAVYSVGSIMPILFGGPNVNSIALKAGFPSYLDVISELQGVSVPVKVVLEIFNSQTTSYTESTNTDGEYSMCYRAGNACPEGHLVCAAEYCEMDVWKKLIADFKAAGTVTVLGSVDSSATQALYAGLDVDGFYFTNGIPVGPADSGTAIFNFTACQAYNCGYEDERGDHEKTCTNGMPHSDHWDPNGRLCTAADRGGCVDYTASGRYQGTKCPSWADGARHVLTPHGTHYFVPNTHGHTGKPFFY